MLPDPSEGCGRGGIPQTAAGHGRRSGLEIKMANIAVSAFPLIKAKIRLVKITFFESNERGWADEFIIVRKK